MLMAHLYLLPNGDKADTMKSARTILGIGTHKFRRLVKEGVVIKIDAKLNNAKTLIAQGDEKQNNLR